MRILLVDEDTASLENLRKVLEKDNSRDEIISFNDPTHVLDYMEQQPVDEVFAEVNMKKITGFALTRYIKEISKQIKVILIAESNEYAMEAWNVHADYFLKKPIILADIMKMRE